MRRVLLLAIALSAIGAAPAAAGSAVSCSFSTHLNFDPGISTPRSAGSFTSDGPGSATCSGVMDGIPVVGDGGLALSGTHRPGRLADRTDVDCLDGVSVMRISTRVRDAVGMEMRRWRRVGGAITVTRLGWAWAGGGEMYGGRSSMSLVAWFTPDAGQDCMNQPVTGGMLNGRLTVRR